ncbi:hypothetical protein KM043_001120 [Ampulex compressa]|nr:hypothetical protein KM043_001120 [Ampulex compressa]
MARTGPRVDSRGSPPGRTPLLSDNPPRPSPLEPRLALGASILSERTGPSKSMIELGFDGASILENL